MFIKNVTEEDVPILRDLAERNYPLDVHTHYTYWVLCSQFGECCYILYDDNKAIGYITSLYNDKTVFVWQIAISNDYRGKGYSQLLIDKVAMLARTKGMNMKVTISTDNKASYNSFYRYCLNHDMKMYEVGSVDLIDLNNKEFHENEVVFNMDFKNNV